MCLPPLAGCERMKSSHCALAEAFWGGCSVSEGLFHSFQHCNFRELFSILLCDEIYIILCFNRIFHNFFDEQLWCHLFFYALCLVREHLIKSFVYESLENQTMFCSPLFAGHETLCQILSFSETQFPYL